MEDIRESFAIIAENDESIWSDQTGVLYHFPKRYLNILQTGTNVIYYKGVLKNSAYRNQRLTQAAHYFGTACIGQVYDDRDSSKGDKFAIIEDFRPFNNPVLNKQNGEYLEQIPASRESNYWRDGVRKIDDKTYQQILALAGGLKSAQIVSSKLPAIENSDDFTFESFVEGDKTRKYVTKYERDPKLRQIAVRIHGYICKGCGFNFENFYGEHGKEFIHVHHLNPISELGGAHLVNPKTDLTVLCPNCHAMVHRFKSKTLSLEELQKIIKDQADALLSVDSG